MKKVLFLALCLASGIHTTVIAQKFLAVGSSRSNTSPMICTSDDGLNWEVQYDKKGMWFVDAAYGNGVFATISSDYRFLYSEDGKNWQTANTPDMSIYRSGTMGGITYGDGLFVAVGDGEKILYSSNGIDWKMWGGSAEEKKAQIKLDSEKTKSKKKLMDKAGLGRGSKLGNKMRKADKIANPTEKKDRNGTDPGTLSSKTHFRGVGFANGHFYLVGSHGRITRFKADGSGGISLIGTFVPESPSASDINYAAAGSEDRVVVVGMRGPNMTPDDGVTWKKGIFGDVGAQGRTIAYGNGVFVSGNFHSDLWSSSDGLIWDGGKVGLREQFRSVVFDGERFLAHTEKGKVYTSTDGQEWKASKPAFTHSSSITGRPKVTSPMLTRVIQVK